MSKVYLDNAATTPLDPRVIEAMTEVMTGCYGNPSATHSLGRKARGYVETARRTIATNIGANPKEIVFTSGGTEADNMAIRCAVRDLGITTIITDRAEHKAVLQTSEELEHMKLVRVVYVDLDGEGRVNYDHLEKLATRNKGALISIMHANNEIGTTVDLKRVSSIARANACYFHSDTVQTIGHLPINVQDIDIDFITCSAHKLHGPKGTGFLYVSNALPIKAMITGGGQERSQRAGTENVMGIVGLSKALEIAIENFDEECDRISNLKQYMKNRLIEAIPDIEFNGDTSREGSLCTVLSASLPPTDFNSLILFKMDIEGICCSGGSACNSGANTGSHVLNAIGANNDRQAVRFSFGRFTTEDDVEMAIGAMRRVLEREELESA